MLRNDNDRRLWENIRKAKSDDQISWASHAHIYADLHDVHGNVDRIPHDTNYGNKFQLVYRWLYKFWNKLFIKQDSQ